MKKTVFCLFLFLFLSVGLFSMPIKMKDGTVINGKIFSSNQASVVIMDERGNVISVPADSLMPPDGILPEASKPYRMFAAGIDLGCALQSAIFGNFGTGINFEAAIERSFSFNISFYGGTDTPYYTTLIGFFIFHRQIVPNFLLGLDWRWYPGSNSLSDFWVGAGVNVVFWMDGYRPVFNFFPLVSAGYKFKFGTSNGFFLEPYLSLGFNIGIINSFGLRAGWMWN
jgi:hypothetical protein